MQDLLNRTQAKEPLNWYKTLEQYYYRDEWELFDLKKDADELHNLATVPSYQVRGLREKNRLRKAWQTSRDPVDKANWSRKVHAVREMVKEYRNSVWEDKIESFHPTSHRNSRCRDILLFHRDSHCRDSHPTSHRNSRCRDILLFHRDSHCQDSHPTSHRNSRCRDFLRFHHDSRCRDILLFHRDSRCRNILADLYPTPTHTGLNTTLQSP
uniref:Uncharacterized protein n=1 Tax=Timema tahoe TaxID=61484 RepID=A0A7R9NWX5_9NEOP|nr:unnamed protein product [Timema tahoe]